MLYSWSLSGRTLVGVFVLASRTQLKQTRTFPVTLPEDWGPKRKRLPLSRAEL